MLGGVWIGAASQCVIFFCDPRRFETQWRAVVPSAGILARYARLLFGDWFGAPYDGRMAAAVLAIAVAAWLAIWIARGQQHRGPAVLMLLGALAFLCAGRAASPHWGHPFDVGSRYVFLPYAAAFWSLGWLAAGVDGWRRAVPALLAAAVIASALSNWTADLLPDLHWRAQVAALRDGRTPIFADPRTLGKRCFNPVDHSAMLWVPATATNNQIQAYAICVPCPGPVTTEDPAVYLRKLQLP